MFVSREVQGSKLTETCPRHTLVPSATGPLCMSLGGCSASENLLIHVFPHATQMDCVSSTVQANAVALASLAWQDVGARGSLTGGADVCLVSTALSLSSFVRLGGCQPRRWGPGRQATLGVTTVGSRVRTQDGARGLPSNCPDANLPGHRSPCWASTPGQPTFCGEDRQAEKHCAEQAGDKQKSHGGAGSLVLGAAGPQKPCSEVFIVTGRGVSRWAGQ